MLELIVEIIEKKSQNRSQISIDIRKCITEHDNLNIDLTKDDWSKVRKEIPYKIRPYNIIFKRNKLCLEYISNDSYHVPICNIEIIEKDQIVTLSMRNDNYKKFNILITEVILACLTNDIYEPILREKTRWDCLEW